MFGFYFLKTVIIKATPGSLRVIPIVEKAGHRTYSQKHSLRGFPGGAVVENPPANAGDTGSSPGPGRSHMPHSN